MSSSQPSTQTTTTESEPWADSQPYLRDVMSQAQSLYNSEQGRQYYPMSTTVPFSNQTADALQMQEDLARQGNQLVQPAMSNVQAMMGQGPTAGTGAVGDIAGGSMSFTPGQPIVDAAAGQQSAMGQMAGNVYGQAASGGMNNSYGNSLSQFGDANSRVTAADGLSGAAQQADPTKAFYANAQAGGISNNAADGMSALAGREDPSRGFYENMSQGGMQNGTAFTPFTQGGATPSQEYLSSMAEGGSNPHLDRMYERASNKVRDQINAVFSANGRYGSSAHQAELADQMGDMASNMYGQQYNADQGRRLQATGQIQGAHDNQQNRALTATGQQAGLREADLGRQSQGADRLSGVASQNFARNAQAASMMGQQNEANLGRQFQGAGNLSNQFNQGFGRLAQTAGMQGQFQGQDLSRQLGATQATAGLEAQDRSRQMQGASSLQGLQGQGFGQMAQANQMMGSAMNQNAGNMMQGAQTASDLQGAQNQRQLAAMQSIPALRNMQFDDASRLAQTGTAREQQAADQLGDAMRRWDYGQQQPYNQLAQYSGLVNGMGALGMSGSSTAPLQRTNPLMGAAGGALSGASMGSMFGPMGTAIGGGVGLLGGLFG